MNFFEHQDRARRNTTRLVGLFGVAVVGLIAAAYAVVMTIFVVGTSQLPEHAEALGGLGRGGLWRPDILVGVAVAVVGVVSAGSLYKTAQLAGGGEALAVSLGGRRLLADSPDPLERKVLNVVEEMAIACGLPVPPVYLMDGEEGINAFAAGYRPEEAVIGVTRGCAEQLSRDELQGVIAHEFSHILNGDMRLNIRLIAIVHGILLVGLIGYYTLRLAASSNTRRRSDDKGSPAAAFMALGLGLMAVGFAGTLVGNLIKAAVSRQREFLADASAVQFTRNPDSIAGALKRIGGFQGGSRLEAPRATEASHMFFASGVSALFATHPPLEDRITRIDQYWHAEQKIGGAAAQPTAGEASPGMSGLVSGVESSTPAPSPAAAVNAIGRLTPAQLERSRELLAGLPPELRAAAHEPLGSEAIVYALLLDSTDAIRDGQFVSLASGVEPPVVAETRRILPMVVTLAPDLRLPVVEICLGPLKNLSREQYERFRGSVIALVAADNRLNLFEWCLQKVVFHVLDQAFGQPRPRGPRPGKEHAAVVLSALAHAGSGDAAQVREAFERGVQATGLGPLPLAPWDANMFALLDTALDALGRLKPSAKATLVRGLAETAAADGRIAPREMEVLRAITTTLDCPLPLIG